MASFDSWESYFYPETYDPAYGTGTMRNLFDERDFFALRDREYLATRSRQQELRVGIADVPRTFDAEHVKAIHAYVFQDVYEWAGQYRSVDIAKGSPRGFASVKDSEIDKYLSEVHAKATATDWSRLDREGFVARSSEVFAYLNQAHPFREGNGRTAKIFMEHVAELSAFAYDWQQVGVEEWNRASMYSGPDLYAYEPHPEELVSVFDQLVVDRDDHGVATEPAEVSRSLYAASYPQAAGVAGQRKAAGAELAAKPGLGTGDRGVGR